MKETLTRADAKKLLLRLVTEDRGLKPVALGLVATGKITAAFFVQSENFFATLWPGRDESHNDLWTDLNTLSSKLFRSSEPTADDALRLVSFILDLPE